MPIRKKRVKQAAIVEAFAARLKDLRTSRGMTQKNLADKAGVTLTYISKLEAGGAAPGLDLMERLARALDLDLTELLPKVISSESESRRRNVLKRFEALVANSGDETLGMLGVLIATLADSPGSRR